MSRWSLDDAVTFVRELEKAIAPDYHVTLAGSVLHKGSSRNDLDVFVFPHSTDVNDFGKLRSLFEAHGMRLWVDNKGVRRKWARGGSTDTKFVEIWKTKEGKRVDVFQPYMTPFKALAATMPDLPEGPLAVPGLFCSQCFAFDPVECMKHSDNGYDAYGKCNCNCH